jgi:hypothetical protein
MKILMVAVAFLAIAMIASPVMALGPYKAGDSNNPHLFYPEPGAVSVETPSGVHNEWIQEAPDNEYSHVMMKRAVDFTIQNAYVPSSASEVVYNKWNLLSEDVFMDFLINLGFPPEGAYYVSHVVMAGGVYYKESFMGNSK